MTRLVGVVVGVFVVGALSFVTPAGAQVSQLQVDPGRVSVNVGQRFEVLATALDRGNNVLLDVQFQWVSQVWCRAGVRRRAIGDDRGRGAGYRRRRPDR